VTSEDALDLRGVTDIDPLETIARLSLSSARFARLAAYVSASTLTTLIHRSPAPPVVHTGDEVCAGLLSHCFQCARSWKQRSHQFLLKMRPVQRLS
jgi:hypothetical protein